MRRFTEKARSAVHGFLTVGLLVLVGFWGSVPATQASEEIASKAPALHVGPSLVDKTLDAVFIRPLKALSLVAGTGFFFVTLPVTVLTKQVGIAREVLLEPGYEEAFVRPLGDI